VIEGLAWLTTSVAALWASAWIISRAVVTSVTAYRKRHHEPPTLTPPSAVCTQCGGAWGKWSELIVDTRPNNPTYPSLYGHHQTRSQVRTCTECGYGERRVLA
jgi:hypothetical protein